MSSYFKNSEYCLYMRIYSEYVVYIYQESSRIKINYSYLDKKLDYK